MIPPFPRPSPRTGHCKRQHKKGAQLTQSVYTGLMEKYPAFLVLIFAFTGCAHSYGIVPTGPDSYMIQRRGASGFAGLGTLKMDAIQEASEYCQKDGRQIQVISSTEGRQFADFPRAEVNFICLKPGEAARSISGPTPEQRQATAAEQQAGAAQDANAIQMMKFTNEQHTFKPMPVPQLPTTTQRQTHCTTLGNQTNCTTN